MPGKFVSTHSYSWCADRNTLVCSLKIHLLLLNIHPDIISHLLKLQECVVKQLLGFKIASQITQRANFIPALKENENHHQW